MEQPLNLFPGEEMEDRRSISLRGKFHAFRTTAWSTYKSKPITHWILLALCSASMLLNFPAATLLSRVYYADGGKSKWIISWVAIAGWPISALILIPTYFIFGIFPTPLNFKLIISYATLGFLSMADNLLYAYGYAYLPASTASLLESTSLVFSALFGYLLVKNKINASIINAIVIITCAMAIIALNSDSNGYGSVTDSQYAIGFIVTILASAVHGLVFAVTELIFVKLSGRRSFHVVLEQQALVSLFGFIFTTIGVVVNNDFKTMEYEAKSFKGGRSSYISVVIWAAITFHLAILGGTGVVFLASTILGGVLKATSVPITSVVAVIVLNDPMSGVEILSLVITFWGFGSYIYGSSK